jgi:AcrR family transcriptional regulator
MKKMLESGAKRPYRMQARAEAAEQTRRRVLQGFIELYMERWLDQISLEDVAGRAGVTVQTLLRRFGSKGGLIAAAGEELRQQVEAQRAQAPVGDVTGAVRNLFDHYEEVGDLVLRSLAQEGMYPPIRALTDRGRRFHQEWVTDTFAPSLARASGSERVRLGAQLIAITDVYVWKLLRHDLGLERAQAELALREMIDGLQPERDPSRVGGGPDGDR